MGCSPQGGGECAFGLVGNDEQLQRRKDTFTRQGDQINLKLGGKAVAVRCVDIREDAVVVSIEGETRELRVK